MVNNAQQYINDKYPQNEVCKSGSDKENKGKKREDITILDLSKGKVGKGFLNSDGKILEGSLKLEGFTNLQKLNISSQQITNLDVTSCSNLKEVDLSNCPNELIENEDAIKSHLVFNIKKTKLVKAPIVTPVEENVRNVLLVGWTGSGKSTLANVLTGTNEFKESNRGISETVSFQTNEFDWEKDKKTIKYHIIDNIGFGDTRKESIKEEDVLFRIGDAIYSAQEGINQILFVVKGKFTKEHTESFNLFEKFISDTGITEFTTIVITDFQDFRDSDSCKEDKVALIRENKNIRVIIESCKEVIHVDNPSVPKKGSEQEIKINKEKREKSRELVLNHLVENCQNIYKIEEWDKLYSMITKYKEIEKSLDNTEAGQKKLVEAKESLFKELRVKLELSMPGLPIGLKAEIEVIK